MTDPDEGDDVIRGRQAIVDAWLRQPDPPGTYEGRYRPLVVQGDSAITTGTSRYYTDASRTTLDREYHNLFVLHFAGDGRAAGRPHGGRPAVQGGGRRRKRSFSGCRSRWWRSQ
jgi:hypothetical protein